MVSAERYDHVKRMPGVERAQVLDERNLCGLIAVARRYERMVCDVQRYRRLAAQFVANGFGVCAPGPKLRAQ